MRTLILLALSLMGTLFLTGGCNKTDAKSSSNRQVVLYCSADQEFAEKVVARFTEKTGIKVLPRYDTEAIKTLGMVQRLRSESAKPQTDVFWSSEIFETIRLANDNILAPCVTPTTQSWPKQYSDPQGRWYGFALRARVIAYNTNLVKPDEAPKSIEDLLDPRWKGKILLARPMFGTTRGHVAAMWVHYGPDRAQSIFQGLAENKVRIVNGNSTAVRHIAEGQASVCLTDTDDVWVAQRNGWPVKMVYPKHGTAGTLIIPNTVAMIRQGPNPKEAAALIDFLLSEEVETMLAESDSHNIPVSKKLAEKFQQYQVANPMTVDYIKISEAINPALQSAGKILQQ